MLSSVSSLLALALLAMTGSANGLAMSTSLVEREEPLPIACCSDSVPFRLRMKTNIKDDDPMADQKRNHYFSDKNPCYIAFSPDSGGEKDITLSLGTEGASVFEFMTLSPTEAASPVYEKLRIIQYNKTSSLWDPSLDKHYVSEGTDRVEGQGYHSLVLTKYANHATNFTTSLESRLVYGDSQEPPFVVCYDDHYKRTMAMVVHRNTPGEVIPEVNGMICANVWFIAEPDHDLDL